MYVRLRAQIMGREQRYLGKGVVRSGLGQERSAAEFRHKSRTELLISGPVSRSKVVLDEALRVVAEFQTAGPAWTHSRWRLHDIAAIGVDYQLAVLQAQQNTGPTSLESSMARSLRTLWTGRPVLPGASPIFDVYGAHHAVCGVELADSLRHADTGLH